MANWTPEEQLAFDIAFALKKVAIPGFRKASNEEDRLPKQLLRIFGCVGGSSQGPRSRCNKAWWVARQRGKLTTK
jgi:hypothetical protein